MKTSWIVAVTMSLVLLLPMATEALGSGADDAIAEAKAANQKADDLQGAWISTGKLIKQAEKANKAGDQAKAKSLAKKAKKEAELAYVQAKHELDNWSEPSFLLNPDEKAGKSKVSRCNRCHQPDDEDNPHLCGQPADYLVDSINAYRDGSRHHKKMKRMVAKLSPADITAIANYYSAQPCMK